MKNKILLVDGMALLFRGYYATAYTRNFMINENGIATNGVHQFLRYFISGYETFQPTHVVFCWDMGKQTFRTEVYPEYKSNREDPPEQLIPQFDLVKDVVKLFDLPNIGIKNYEADDIIGTIAKKYGKTNEIIIQTGDQDLLQLVDHHVSVAIMKKGIGNYEIYNINNFYDKKGIYPKQILDFKGFTGDAADNYPGIKGIGEKTALKLLQTYENMEEIIDSIEQLSPGLQRRINNHLSMFYLSKGLATIKCDVQFPFELETAYVQFNHEKIANGFQQYGLRVKSLNELFTKQ